jgi:two-component system OmpR family response regulator
VRIVVVEDEPRTARVLARELRRRGYSVGAVMSAAEAVEQAGNPDVALVVVDLDAAEDDGLTALRRLAHGSSVPVVVLAQRDALEREEDLDPSALDVVTKPLTARDVVTRVRRRLERPAPPSRTLRSGAIRLEPDTRRVTVRGRTVRLSVREYELLLALMRDPGRAISREELLARVWGIDFEARTNVLRVYVAYLRRKLGRSSIETVRGHGYRMAE